MWSRQPWCFPWEEAGRHVQACSETRISFPLLGCWPWGGWGQASRSDKYWCVALSRTSAHTMKAVPLNWECQNFHREASCLVDGGYLIPCCLRLHNKHVFICRAADLYLLLTNIEYVCIFTYEHSLENCPDPLGSVHAFEGQAWRSRDVFKYYVLLLK